MGAGHVTFTMIAAVVVLTTVVIAMPAVAVSVSRLIFRYVDVVIPLMLHEIDRPATGIVFMTMFSPVFFVSRRNMQIERRIRHTHRHGSDHDRLRINDLWPWKGSDIDPAIKAWLTDTDRHAHIGGLCRDRKSDCHDDEENMFHARLLYGPR